MRRAASNPVDRRLTPRVLVDLEVDYQHEENFLFAYITDISATGIFVRTTTPESVGTYLNLRFSLPSSESDDDDDDSELQLEGEVIWINPYRPGARDSLNPGMGVRFRGLDEPTKRRLLALIRRIAYLT